MEMQNNNKKNKIDTKILWHKINNSKKQLDLLV